MSVDPLIDQQFLHRAIELARRGRGRVEPNPMVGCVLVKDGQIISEGFHHHYGGPHAEPTALADCKVSPEGATAYVTLEPCCHLNKKTPPCAPKLISAGIRRVVIGCLDPNPQVDSKGIAMLRAADIEVVGPLLEPRMRQLNAPFFKRTLFSRPYVTLKWAQSRNGKVAGGGGKRRQISSPAAMKAVHQLRARSDIILVGIRTVLSDDPNLTVRGVEIVRPLTRALLDPQLRLPSTANLAMTGAGEVIVFCTRATYHNSPRVAELERLGLRIIPMSSDDLQHLVLDDVLLDLDEKGTHLLVEPGPILAANFFAANAADRVWVIESPNEINASDAPTAANVPSHFVETGQVVLGGDVLREYLNPNSPVFYAPDPSTDLVGLARQEAIAITG